MPKKSRVIRVLLIGLLAVVVAAVLLRLCERGVHSDETLLRISPQLLLDADEVMAKYPTSDVRLEPKEWPSSIQQLAPAQVHVRPEGLYLMFRRRFVQEWGVFILRSSSDFTPQEGTDPSFKRVKDRLYRYHIAG